VWIERGKHAALNRMIGEYLSRRAMSQTGIFNYGQVTAWRWFWRFLPFGSGFKRMLNNGLYLIPTVQIRRAHMPRASLENSGLSRSSRESAAASTPSSSTRAFTTRRQLEQAPQRRRQ
jgi:hypothetical protein